MVIKKRPFFKLGRLIQAIFGCLLRIRRVCRIAVRRLFSFRSRVVYVFHKISVAAAGANKKPVRHIFPFGKKCNQAAGLKTIPAM